MESWSGLDADTMHTTDKEPEFRLVGDALKVNHLPKFD